MQEAFFTWARHISGQPQGSKTKHHNEFNI